MMIKSRKKVLNVVIAILMTGIFTCFVAGTVTTKEETDILLDNVEEVETIKLMPETFDELMAKSEFKEVRDSLYLISKKVVESNLNSNAFNQKELARGVLQIRPIMVRECNNILASQGINKRYVDSDCFNPVKAEEIYWIVQNKHNPNFDLFTASAVWNGGHTPNKLSGSVINKVRTYHNKIIKEMEISYCKNKG